MLGCLLLAACAVTSSPSISSGSPAVVASAAPTTSLAPSGSASPGVTPPIALPQPGRPYDAADILDAMRESRRPGGVPDQLVREAIATAVAADVWTYDGTPWPLLVASGSCGAESCTLEVAGAPAEALGEDLYIFRVDPATGAVEVVSAVLRGLPASHAETLDTFVRERWPASEPVPGPLASARWLPPPSDAVFILSYRAGGEEGSPAVDALVDLRSGEVELQEPG